MLRAVVFDLGGTLVSFRVSGMDWRTLEERGIASLCQFLLARGQRLPEAEFRQQMWDTLDRGWRAAMSGEANLRLEEVIVTVAGRFGVTLAGDVLAQAVLAYTSGVGGLAAPLEGAQATLRSLKARGLRLGLLSNTMWPAQLHRDHMAECGLLEFFDVTAFSSETGLWKPNAPAFQSVAERLGVSPQETVFVGDLPDADVLGAQRAGMRAVWIASDGIELGDVQPDAVIHRLSELPALLEPLSSHSG